MTKQNKDKAQSRKGWINGLIGVLLFSGSMPATKLAVMDLSPSYVTVFRAGTAGILAVIALLLFKEKLPSKKHLPSLLIISFSVVLGFPLLSALALEYITSAHSLIFIGLLPLSTALFGVIRGGERPPLLFWIFSFLGALMVVAFAFSKGAEASLIGDSLMIIAIILCGLGYAEGAKLSTSLGGWQTISWALVIALPIMIPLLFILWPSSIEHVHVKAWGGLAYISIFSMLVGFIFWYRGLSQGGIAAVGQLQLLQPFFGLALAAGFLNEHVSIGLLGTMIGVIFCVAGSKKFAAQKTQAPLLTSTDNQ